MLEEKGSSFKELDRHMTVLAEILNNLRATLAVLDEVIAGHAAVDLGEAGLAACVKSYVSFTAASGWPWKV